MATILIVDDDPDIVEACQLFLEKAGHRVEAAYNRPDGMAAMAAVRPDLLILDVIMDQPDDGIVMAQELHRQGSKVPILMVTSIRRVTGLSYGPESEPVPVDAFLEKPVDPATLLCKVTELLAGRKS